MRVIPGECRLDALSAMGVVDIAVQRHALTAFFGAVALRSLV
jgi:hypothetical protein